MRGFAALVFFLSISSSAFAAKTLFENQGLQQWYLRLQNFEEADLDSPLLKDCSPLEFRFAAIQFHWQSLLRGGSGNHYLKLQELHKRPVPGLRSAEERHLEKVLTAFFLARAAALKGESLSSLTAYTGASSSMEELLKLKNPGGETQLLCTIYSLGYQQLNSNPLYWTILAWLPSPQQELDRNQLLRFQEKKSPILRTEATYFAFRIFKDENPQFARKQLARLIERFPRNWIYRLEYYRNFGLDEDQTGRQMSVLQKELKAARYLSPAEKAHFKAVLEEM